MKRGYAVFAGGKVYHIAILSENGDESLCYGGGAGPFLRSAEWGARLSLGIFKYRDAISSSGTTKRYAPLSDLRQKRTEIRGPAINVLARTKSKIKSGRQSTETPVAAIVISWCGCNRSVANFIRHRHKKN